MSRVWVAAVAAVSVLIARGDASASAWNVPEKHGIIIADYTLLTGNDYFNGRGVLSRGAAYSRQDLSGYLEYGITDSVMAVVRPQLTTISAASLGDPTDRYTGLGTGELAVQWQALVYGPAVLAVSGGFRLPGSTNENNPALVGNTSLDTDLRGHGGVAFPVGSWPAFLDGEFGYRFRSGIAPDEWHGDLTLGARPLPDWLVFVQSFNTLSAAAGTQAIPRSFSSKAAVTVVYDLTARWSVELSVFETVFGYNALRERGGKAGVWYRF